METLKKIDKLIHDTDEQIFDLFDKYPTSNELKNSEEYKALCIKLKAYEEVFRIVQHDLRELRRMVNEMEDL